MSLVIATKSALVADNYMAKAEEPIHYSRKTTGCTLSVEGGSVNVDIGWVGYMHSGKLIAGWVKDAIETLIKAEGTKYTEWESISTPLMDKCREYGERSERLKDMLGATCLAVRIEIDTAVDAKTMTGGKRTVLLQIDNGFVTMDMTANGYVILGPSAVVSYVTGWLDRHTLTERRLEEPVLLQCLEHAAKRMDYVSVRNKP